MKVFIVIEEGNYHYESTDYMVRGVYSSEKDALDRVRMDAPNAKRNGHPWACPDTKGWDSRYMTIEYWKVQ